VEKVFEFVGMHNRGLGYMGLLKYLAIPPSFAITVGSTPLPLPLKKMYAGAIWRWLFPVLQRVGPMQRVALRSGNIQDDILRKHPETGDNLDAIPYPEKEDVSVLFSGGADSTLSSFLLAERFRRVHLLTFTHLGCPRSEKPKINAAALIEHFGPAKVSHHIIDVDVLVRAIYRDRFAACFARYGFLAQNFCGSCKFGMLCAAIIYNAKHGIRYSASGSHMEGAGVWIEQMPHVNSQVIRPLFHEFGMEILTPVYYIRGTDRIVYEKRLTEIEKTKFPRDNTDYQEWCNFSVQHNIYARGYYLQLWGQQKLNEISLGYAREKTPCMRRQIRKAIAGDGAFLPLGTAVSP
jgi:hypothetical protein